MGQFLPQLVSRADKFANCTLDTCPISDSLYGYLPSKPATLFAMALFIISFLVHLFQGIKSKSWTFLFALGVGTAGEAIGYLGRLLLRKNPWSKGDIGIQLVLLTVCPAFIAGGIYLVLKHIVIIHGRQVSRIAPRSYTRIFISCDVLSIIVQTGGAVMASASSASAARTGNDVMMVGLIFQVVTLAVFGAMVVDVFLRIRQFPGKFNESTENLRGSDRYKRFLIAFGVAYITIFIRCVYRVAEMAGGWKNPIMQDQAGFIALDTVMCVIAVFSLNLFHPGFIFEQSRDTLIKLESLPPTEFEQQTLSLGPRSHSNK